MTGSHQEQASAFNPVRVCDMAETLWLLPEQGQAVAQWRLGNMYNSGDRVQGDKAKAVELYSKAATQGHAGALFNLGQLYYSGDGVQGV